MTAQDKFQKSQELLFFGKVNASISHELKNILAIISETAGFLKDLAEMPPGGESLTQETILTCSRDIIEEVQRGFATIAQMNAFSHSVDVPLKTVNLADVTDMMIGLAGFLKIAGKIKLNPAPRGAAMEVLTSPFQIQHLIYRTIVHAFESSGPDAELEVSIRTVKTDHVRISLTGIAFEGARKIQMDEINRIAASIGAQMELTESDAIEILVPRHPDGLK